MRTVRRRSLERFMTHQRGRWRISGGGGVDGRLLDGPNLLVLRRIGVPLLVAAQLSLSLCRTPARGDAPLSAWWASAASRSSGEALRRFRMVPA